MPVMAVGATDEGRTVIIGLSKKDIMSLLQGNPVTGSLERTTGVKGLDLIIFVGETDESIKADISSSVDTFTLEKNQTAEDLTALLDKDREGKKH